MEIKQIRIKLKIFIKKPTEKKQKIKQNFKKKVSFVVTMNMRLLVVYAISFFNLGFKRKRLFI